MPWVGFEPSIPVSELWNNYDSTKSNLGIKTRKPKSHTYNWNCGGMFVCMFAYISRTDKAICTRVGMLIPWDQEKILEMSEPREKLS
jgi:hypothetical protein